VQRHAPAREGDRGGRTPHALRANEGILEAVEATREQIRAGEHKDPSTAARNLAVAAGVTTDKSLLLEGRPTEIHGTDMESLMATMARALGVQHVPNLATDSTAEEIEPPEPGRNYEP
jgi:hypothetical protein